MNLDKKIHEHLILKTSKELDNKILGLAASELKQEGPSWYFELTGALSLSVVMIFAIYFLSKGPVVVEVTKKEDIELMLDYENAQYLAEIPVEFGDIDEDEWEVLLQ